MTTSERKNAKRLKALHALQVTNPEYAEAEMRRLWQAWSAEVWVRIRNRKGESASALIQTASRFGLGKEIALEVIQAVHSELGGPGFVSRSLAVQKKASHMISKLERQYGLQHGERPSETAGTPCAVPYSDRP